MLGLHASGAAASWVWGGWARNHGRVPLHLDDAAIPAFLDSRFDADKVDALKRLLAVVAQVIDVRRLFQQLKNLGAQSLEVKQSKRGTGSWTGLAIPSIARQQFDEMRPTLLLSIRWFFMSRRINGHSIASISEN